MYIDNPLRFSLSSQHPMKAWKEKERIQYAKALTVLLSQVPTLSDHSKVWVQKFKNELIFDIASNVDLAGDFQDLHRVLKHHIFRKRLNLQAKYLVFDYYLICALSSSNQTPCNIDNIISYSPERRTSEIREYFDVLHSDWGNPEIGSIDPRVNEWIENQRFEMSLSKQYIVTAVMSAGKSTLVNALFGTKIAKTKSGACTSSVNYYCNKRHCDNITTVSHSGISYSSLLSTDIFQALPDDGSSFTVYQTMFSPNEQQCTNPIVIIDTPGVDAALHREHGTKAFEALNRLSGSDIICVLSGTSGFGNDTQDYHLKKLRKLCEENRRISFVITKLDEINDEEDESISEILSSMSEYLASLGFSSPELLPVSAEAGFLMKRFMSGCSLSADEERRLTNYVNLFSRPEYDLSVYYKSYLPQKEELINQHFQKCGILHQYIATGLPALENYLYQRSEE